jgi:hypothetical protein
VVASYHRHSAAEGGVDGNHRPVSPFVLQMAAEASGHDPHRHDRYQQIVFLKEPLHPLLLIKD